jgi:signal transduction histidine kinase
VGRSTRSRDVEAYADDWVGYHPDGRRYAAHEWPLARAVREGVAVHDELIECERPDGSRFLVEVNAAPVRGGDGRVIAGVVVFSDVTARQRTEEAERAARAAAEGASRAKSDFLGTMSHELRTPLNAIGGYVQLLEMELRGPVTEAQRLDLSRITRAQRHLLGLVNDVLDFARIEAGTVAYATDVVPLADVVTHAHALVAPQLADKGLRYTGDVDGVAAWADRERVEQIVLNVLANAVKFTPVGGAIDVRADVEGAQACLHVRDTGPGIPASAHEAIFQPFVQLSTGLTRTSEGSGLGLAISRDLARAMGGDVTVESVPGDGATFTLRLPAVPATHAAAR